MKAKHYVSFEAARLLKEKGYNEECEYAYNEINMQIERIGANANYISDYCSAPTLLEAMDWLEERGIGIEITYDSIDNEWFSSVTILSKRLSSLADSGKDRNECMNEAIKKGLELL